MKRKLAIVICCVLLASGLIRIGVGGMMIGQAAGWWALDGEAAEALANTPNRPPRELAPGECSQEWCARRTMGLSRRHVVLASQSVATGRLRDHSDPVLDGHS